MLTYLSVKNLTVIESASMEFGAGLNIITGETGAGKSVLVGALKFLTGERFNRAVLRDPEKKLSVEGIFTEVSRIDAGSIEQYEIDNELILSRESDDSGKNKVSVNGRVAPVTKLKELSEYLIDIHGQHEHQLLFDSFRHLEFLDFFVKNELKDNYKSAYKFYKDKLDELETVRKQISETSKLRQMYEFQLEELESIKLDLENDSKIDEKIEFLSHIEKIREATALSIDVLKEAELSACELIDKAAKAISNVSNLAPELLKASESLETASSSIYDAVSYIESVFSMQESSPEELNKLIDRKYKLVALQKKYGVGIDTLIAYREKVKADLENATSSDAVLLKFEKESEKFQTAAACAANKLNDDRKSAAKKVSERVELILKELELGQSRFEVRFTELGKLDANGGVTAEFYISTNAGFEPGPLATVASGGEISRVMLALKEVFAEADAIPTLLFDEIDTGISGRAAKSVAAKLKRLSKSKQIIVITHLPVVAAQGAVHFHISKSLDNGVSKTTILKLDDVSRKHIIATMISGEATQSSLAQADELLKEESGK